MSSALTLDRGAQSAPARPPMAWRTLLDPQRARPRTMAAIDVGAHKIVCYMARRSLSGGFDVLGRGYQAAEGVVDGEIVDLHAAQDAIAGALHQLESAAGEPVRDAILIYGGRGSRAVAHRMRAPLGGRRACVEDVEAMLWRAALAVEGAGAVALHATPVAFSVDGGRPQGRIEGLVGGELEMDVRLLVVDKARLEAVIGALGNCHVRVRDVVAGGYAGALATAHVDEAERGVLVIDMGGGSTTFCTLGGGRLTWCDRTGRGGDKVTSDVAYILETSMSQAERLKNLFGCATPRVCDDNARISYPLLDDMVDMPTGEAPRSLLTRVIRPRVEEILEEGRERMAEAWDLIGHKPPRSVILTGGGSQLEGLADLVGEMFELPTRLGRPIGVFRRDPGEAAPCCAAIAGGFALSAGDDGGLSWRARNTDARGVKFRLSHLRRWLNECF